MGWLDKLGENIKYAHTVNNLGPAYAVTGQVKEDLRKQGKEEEARKIEKAEAIGTVGGAIAGLTLGKGVPALMRGVKAFRAAHPIISGAIDAGLTVDGVRNALSDNGVEKTINYIKDGNWGRAAASGTMDALDLLGGVGLAGDAARYSKKAYNRLLETLVRIGDNFSPRPISSAMTLLFGGYGKGLRYVAFGNPDLAYKLPYDYSGQMVFHDLHADNHAPAHKGDLIDVLFGKTDELIDNNGNTLAKLSTDISNVPEKTILAFQTIPGQSNKTPRVLQFVQRMSGPVYLHKPLLGGSALVQGVPLEIARFNVGDVWFTKPPFLPSSGIDPGHFGVTALKTSDGIQLFGHDVYHFSPKLYAKTHHPSKIIPKLNITAGQPFIAEWKIPEIHSPLNFDVKIPTVPTEGVTYTTSGHSLIFRPNKFSQWDLFLTLDYIHKPKRGSIFHKSGGKLNYLNLFKK